MAGGRWAGEVKWESGKGKMEEGGRGGAVWGQHDPAHHAHLIKG